MKKNYFHRLITLGLATTLTLGLSASSVTVSQAQNRPTVSTNASQSGTADADMQAVLDALQSLNSKPLEGLSPAEAHRQPLAIRYRTSGFKATW